MSQSNHSIIATPPRQKNQKIDDMENDIKRVNKEIYIKDTESDRRHTITPLERLRDVSRINIF